MQLLTAKVVLLPSGSFASENLPSSLVEIFLPAMPAIQFPDTSDNRLNEGYRISGSTSFDYFNLIHQKKFDRQRNGRTLYEARAATPLVSPLMNSYRAVVENHRWGIMPHWSNRRFAISWFDQNEDYVVDSRFEKSSLTISTWLSTPYTYTLVALGYAYRGGFDTISNKSEPAFPVNTVGRNLQNPLVECQFFQNVSLKRFCLNLKLGKAVSHSSITRITNRSNSSYVNFPIVLLNFEKKLKLGYYAKFGHFSIDGKLFSLISDTSFTTQKSLASYVEMDGFSLAFSGSGRGLSVNPQGAFTIGRANLSARGLDGPTRYFWLDSNNVYQFKYNIGVALQNNRLTIGHAAEWASLRSRDHGRFDPYPFSSFLILRPNKYRLDSLMFAYRAVGGYLDYRFTVAQKHCFSLYLSVYDISLRGALGTREWDFAIPFIPILKNPQQYDIVNKEALLFRPGIGYRYCVASFAAGINLDQLAPIDKRNFKRSSSSSGSSGSRIKTTLTGGTRIRCDFSVMY
ncbi:MAG: hypothetical protein GF398_16575 [Chitinivibrionales bacterium]|nr:hypothetical protein [Chitinivibrionales bacterium]